MTVRLPCNRSLVSSSSALAVAMSEGRKSVPTLSVMSQTSVNPGCQSEW